MPHTHDLPTENGENNSDGELSFIDLLAIVLRHKKRIVLVTIAAAVLSMVYVVGSLLLPSEESYLPNLYKPTATMLVNSPDSSGGLSSMIAASGLTSLAGAAGISTGGMNYGQLAIVLGKSNTILDELVEKFDLLKVYKIRKDPKAMSRALLLRHFTIGYTATTGMLTISYEDRDPELAKNIVNNTIDLLDKRFATIGGNRNITKKEQLEAKLADVQAEMTRLEGEIQAFQQRYGVITIDSIAKEQISTVAQVRSELIMKEMEIKTYGDVSKVQDPALMRLQAERDNLSKLLDELDKGFSEYEKVLPTQRELPKLAVDFSHLQRDLLIQEKIFELLTQQYELTKLQIQGADPIIQILEPAEAPEMKSGPKRSMIVIGVTLVSFFAAILLTLVLEAINNVRADPAIMAKLKGGSL